MTALLTIPDVLARLGIHRATLWEWRKTGRFAPEIKVGRTIRFREADIERFLDKSYRKRPLRK